jgi:hypothetical protein
MTGDDTPVEHYALTEPVNIRTALERAGTEYLDVDDHRTVVIYQQTILMIVATEGQATATQAFDVEFWKEPPTGPSIDPDEFLTTFIDELVATTETTRR